MVLAACEASFRSTGLAFEISVQFFEFRPREDDLSGELLEPPEVVVKADFPPS